MIKFDSIYKKTIELSAKPAATFYLFLLSFTEASFFVVPPDVMLAPMCLAQPKKIWRLALIAIIGSVLGGVFGYFIGMFGFNLVQPYIEQYGYQSHYELALQWFSDWGFWAIFIAALTPIPYKIFTIAAGVLVMNFPLFLIASFLGRGLRLFGVACFVKFFGRRVDYFIQRYINQLGWLITGIIGIVIIVEFLTN
ncbi:membrane protein, DedA family [beta proteobacterium KB13]|uniref:Membrane protein, DedA family n=1 Tax=beta proteobacterium KB13 TaxID=314607 RepID=B6BTD2_9PROT|nr:membrane protein, DedA family [beta proteobacterium KB13]